MNTAGLAYGQPVGIPTSSLFVNVHSARYARGTLCTVRCMYCIVVHVQTSSTLICAEESDYGQNQRRGHIPRWRTPQGSQLTMRGEERDARSTARNPVQ